MYHINPACTKNILRRMPINEIPAEMEKIQAKIQQSKPGHERVKFIKLYQYCENLISPSHPG
jgi:hypothetical protein